MMLKSLFGYFSLCIRLLFYFHLILVVIPFPVISRQRGYMYASSYVVLDSVFFKWFLFSDAIYLCSFGLSVIVYLGSCFDSFCRCDYGKGVVRFCV